jgi:hypothetical protein
VTEHFGWDDSLDEVESLLREAGDYVRASEDLRPRVLEAARVQRGERRAQRWIRHLAVVVLYLALITAIGRQEFDAERTRPMGILAAAGFHEFFSPAAIAATRCGDGDWRMLDAFTKLRRQQAEVLRFAL